MTTCASCAATETDGARFPERLPRYRRGKPICEACLDEQRRAAEVSFHVDRQHSITRASYRARLRNRRASEQRDMIDPLLPAP